jgi:hypothetical protein
MMFLYKISMKLVLKMVHQIGKIIIKLLIILIMIIWMWIQDKQKDKFKYRISINQLNIEIIMKIKLI